MTIGVRPEERVNNDHPAPGQYDPDHKLVKPASSKTDFGVRQQRMEQQTDFNPGPGAYSILSSDSKKMTIGQRRDDRINDDVPSPGYYDPDTKLSKPSAMKVNFTRTTERAELQTDFNPGPGYYQHHYPESKQITIGEKREEKMKDPVPAPGYYSPNHKLTKPNS